jgi:peptidyl-prolyl cis-trans isomerase D
VVTELQLEKGQAAAKVAAQRVLAATRQGKDLAAAVAQLGVAVPPVDQVDMPRSELTANGQQIPPPLALLFSMAQGTVKLYPAPRNRGWFLVGVTQIIPGAIPPNDPEVAQARKDLGQLAGREYAEELRRAIRAEVGVTRTDSAIKAALAQVTGGN